MLPDDLLVPGDILHGEGAGLAASAESHSLDLDEVRLPELHKLGVVVHLLCVPSLDQGQPAIEKLDLLIYYDMRYEQCTCTLFSDP